MVYCILPCYTKGLCWIQANKYSNGLRLHKTLLQSWEHILLLHHLEMKADPGRLQEQRVEGKPGLWFHRSAGRKTTEHFSGVPHHHGRAVASQRLCKADSEEERTFQYEGRRRRLGREATQQTWQRDRYGPPWTATPAGMSPTERCRSGTTALPSGLGRGNPPEFQETKGASPFRGVLNKWGFVWSIGTPAQTAHERWLVTVHGAQRSAQLTDYAERPTA